MHFLPLGLLLSRMRMRNNIDIQVTTCTNLREKQKESILMFSEGKQNVSRLSVCRLCRQSSTLISRSIKLKRSLKFRLDNVASQAQCLRFAAKRVCQKYLVDKSCSKLLPAKSLFGTKRPNTEEYDSPERIAPTIFELATRRRAYASTFP